MNNLTDRIYHSLSNDILMTMERYAQPGRRPWSFFARSNEPQRGAGSPLWRLPRAVVAKRRRVREATSHKRSQLTFAATAASRRSEAEVGARSNE